MDTYEQKLIDDFQAEMRAGKKFEMETLDRKSPFTCFMKKDSKGLCLRTSNGNERTTTFLNLERCFNNEPILDEASYVKAICEWLKHNNPEQRETNQNKSTILKKR